MKRQRLREYLRAFAPLALLASIPGIAHAEPTPERGLAQILAEAAEDSRAVRLTIASVLAVSGLAGVIGGGIWASDGDAFDVSPVPLLLVTASGNALFFGVLGLIQPSELERLDARLRGQPGLEAEVERELLAYAKVAHRERIAGGIAATVLGAGFLGAAIWAGLEEEDPGVGFISGMGLGLVGSLGFGAGIGLLTNTSIAEDAAEDVKLWRRVKGHSDDSSTRGLVLQPPSLSVGPDGLFLTVGGHF